MNIWYQYIKGKKECLIFLHGLTGCASAWDFIYPYFQKQGYSILLIDLRGHGLSDKPTKKYGISDLAKDIDSILIKEKINKAIFIGHCYGGIVSQEFYRRYPKKVKSMILISTDFDFTNKNLRYYFSWLTYLLYFIGSIILYPFRFDKNRMHLDYSIFSGGPDFDLKRLYYDIKITSFQTFLKLYKELFKLNYEDVLRKINIPVLIIHGKKDLVLNFKHAIKMSKLIKNSKLELIDTNHISIISIPKIIIEKIDKFLE